MTDLPIIMGPVGPIPIPPATIRSSIVTSVSTTNPDYTANLPASLVEDVVSTDVAGCVVSNQFFVDLVNSVSPYGANLYLLNLIGQNVYGVIPGLETNTSVYVVFTAKDATSGVPLPGFIIGQGFLVSDGTYQYICPDGGITSADGNSLPIYAVATQQGIWDIPEGTVIELISAVPSNVTLSVINYEVGLPASSAESATQYRSRVLTAGLAASTGMGRYLRTLLANVPGVQARLISIVQDYDEGGWNIIVGGGDPYQIAYAIWFALFDTTNILPADIEISGMTNGYPCIISTATNHNLTTGMIITLAEISSPGPTILNNKSFPVSVIDARTLSILTDTTILPPYTSGGDITPNPIVVQVPINDFPDTYLVSFVNPPQELVSITVTWSSNYSNYVSANAIIQLATPAIVDYINSIYAGTSPINLISLSGEFAMAVISILPTEYIDVLNFAISINGVGVLPAPGTQVIIGDPFSYFYTDNAHVTIIQAS
jgi:hypothetical protein